MVDRVPAEIEIVFTNVRLPVVVNFVIAHNYVVTGTASTSDLDRVVVAGADVAIGFVAFDQPVAAGEVVERDAALPIGVDRVPGDPRKCRDAKRPLHPYARVRAVVDLIANNL